MIVEEKASAASLQQSRHEAEDGFAESFACSESLRAPDLSSHDWLWLKLASRGQFLLRAPGFAHAALVFSILAWRRHMSRDNLMDAAYCSVQAC